MKYTGKNGIVKVDSSGGTPAAISQITGFSITETVGTVRADAMGDDFEEHKPTKKSWNGSISLRKDSGDAKQQLLRAGVEIDLELYPEGETTGLEKMSGTALVTSRGVEIEQDGVNSISYDIQGSGALVIDTVPV